MPRAKAPAARLKPVPTPRPFDLADEETDNFLEELHVTANTAEVLAKLGASRSLPEVDAKTLLQEKALLKGAVTGKGKKGTALTTVHSGLGAAQFLRTYASSLALNLAEVRSALTNKLLELADNGDPRIELKAIELLGKHSDIALFTERSEVTVNYNSPEALEQAIRERVKRLLSVDADGIDIVPLEEELGMIEEAEYDIVDDGVEGPEDPEEEADAPVPAEPQADEDVEVEEAPDEPEAA